MTLKPEEMHLLIENAIHELKRSERASLAYSASSMSETVPVYPPKKLANNSNTAFEPIECSPEIGPRTKTHRPSSTTLQSNFSKGVRQ